MRPSAGLTHFLHRGHRVHFSPPYVSSADDLVTGSLQYSHEATRNGGIPFEEERHQSQPNLLRMQLCGDRPTCDRNCVLGPSHICVRQNTWSVLTVRLIPTSPPRTMPDSNVFLFGAETVLHGTSSPCCRSQIPHLASHDEGLRKSSRHLGVSPCTAFGPTPRTLLFLSNRIVESRLRLAVRRICYSLGKIVTSQRSCLNISRSTGHDVVPDTSAVIPESGWDQPYTVVDVIPPLGIISLNHQPPRPFQPRTSS